MQPQPRPGLAASPDGRQAYQRTRRAGIQTSRSRTQRHTENESAAKFSAWSTSSVNGTGAALLLLIDTHNCDIWNRLPY